LQQQQQKKCVSYLSRGRRDRVVAVLSSFFSFSSSFLWVAVVMVVVVAMHLDCLHVQQALQFTEALALFAQGECVGGVRVHEAFEDVGRELVVPFHALVRAQEQEEVEGGEERHDQARDGEHIHVGGGEGEGEERGRGGGPREVHGGGRGRRRRIEKNQARVGE